ncbi:hypothetical protein LP417_35225 (plasmid) [Polaromonas sp. P1-6]|nr:hypothetical protein LP417_35225 [Polaromonas sp. P1-6]
MFAQRLVISFVRRRLSPKLKPIWFNSDLSPRKGAPFVSPCGAKRAFRSAFINPFWRKGLTMETIFAANSETAQKENLRVAQMSDLHYCATNIEEADRCFTAAVTGAIENKVHCALITGDSTDHAMDAHSPALVALAKQIQRLANHCPVLMLQGTFSHEPPGLLRMLSLVGAKHPDCDCRADWLLRTDR